MATSATHPSWLDVRVALQLQAIRFDRHARLVVKTGWFWTPLSWLLFIITFGQLNRDDFLNRFATTIGSYICIPARWSPESADGVLAHECRHVTQFRWFGFGLHPLLGVPFMAFAYLLLPLPLGLAWMRYRLELDADVVAWKHLKVVFPETARELILSRAQRFATTVSSSAYGWAWPRSRALKGFEKAAEKILAA